MKKFKKLTAAMIAGIMVLATAGCSSSSDAEPSASGEKMCIRDSPYGLYFY